MQYINSNLGIPIKASFADMMGVNSYSNASGDSVSSLQTKMRKIENDIRQLQVKKAKEDEKVRKELLKIEDAQKFIKKGKFQQGNKMRNEADYAIREARTEMRNIDSQINLLNIDYNDLKSQLEAMGGAPVPPPITPKPPVPSVPPILDAANIPLGGVFPPRDGVTGTTSQDGSTDTGKSKVNYPVVIIGSVVVLGILYFAVIK